MVRSLSYLLKMNFNAFDLKKKMFTGQGGASEALRPMLVISHHGSVSLAVFTFKSTLWFATIHFLLFQAKCCNFQLLGSLGNCATVV